MTIRDYNSMPRNTLFAQGETKTGKGARMKWVAFKGINDLWVLFVAHGAFHWDDILLRGTKVTSAAVITKFVECDTEMLKQYDHELGITSEED